MWPWPHSASPARGAATSSSLDPSCSTGEHCAAPVRVFTKDIRFPRHIPNLTKPDLTTTEQNSEPQTEILTDATHVYGWEPAVYMSCMSQNFRLFHVSNSSVRNFRICLLMYTGTRRGRQHVFLTRPAEGDPISGAFLFVFHWTLLLALALCAVMAWWATAGLYWLERRYGLATLHDGNYGAGDCLMISLCALFQQGEW